MVANILIASLLIKNEEKNFFEIFFFFFFNSLLYYESNGIYNSIFKNFVDSGILFQDGSFNTCFCYLY